MVIAGALIGFCAIVYQRTGSALLFALGLYTIISMGLPLATGRMADKNVPPWEICKIIIGNLMGVILITVPYALTFGPMDIPSKSNDLFELFILGCLCGISLWIAVKLGALGPVPRAVGVIIAVMAFIKAGFAHSIAEFSYMILSADIRPLEFCAIVLGNYAGARVLEYDKR